MDNYAWLGAAVAIPAALVLVAIFVGMALAMSLRDAKLHRTSLVIAAAAVVACTTIDHLLDLSRVPVLASVFDIARSMAGLWVLLSLIVSVTLLFRRRFRWVGVQMLACGAAAIALAALLQPRE
jgi:hypothetical protein